MTTEPNASGENEQETEADGLIAGALRLLKARHQSKAFTGRIPESLQLPEGLQPTPPEPE